MARVRVTVALAAVVALGCGSAPSAQAPAASPGSAASSAAGNDPVVAEVGGRQIKLSEVDAKWQEFDAAERARLTQLLYQNRRNMLDLLMGDVLIADAAKAANTSVEAYTEREITRRLQPIAEADIQRFYEENKERAQGRTIEQLRQPIVEYLQSQRQGQARAQLVDELRGKSSRVRILLDPPRVEVSVAASDPSRGESTAPITLVEYSDYQ